MKKGSLFKRVLIFVLVAVVALGSVVTVNAAPVETKTGEKPYVIAVAYDNSGSMYGTSGRWCYAKYAMEIFASMMDLTGRDTLTVFTMHNINTDGVSSARRFVVGSVADIDKIHKMVTPSAGGTPFTPVEEAYEYLRGADPNNEKERWLIVLTDGAFDGLSGNNLKKKLTKMADGTNINVQYIPFGGSVLSDDSSSDAFHASPNISGNDGLRTELVSVCNKIFERDELRNRLNGQTLTIDLSMKRVIVFVQGKGASITALKDPNGNPVKVLMDSGTRKYSEYSNGQSGKASKMPNDVKDQQGQVVTFGACTKGTYTLDYSADMVQIFYEPDVTMKIEFVNQDGTVEDFSDGSIPPGEYTFNAKLVDRVTGEDVSGHELLGSNVTIDASIKYKGETPIALKPGDKVDLKPGKGVDFDITATYLDRYKLNDRDCPDLPDFSNINVEVPNPELSIKADVKQSKSWYVLKDHKNWKPIRLDIKMNGAPLTDDQLKKATLNVWFEGADKNIEYHTELLYGESAVNVYIGTDETGKYTAPKMGGYTLKASAKAFDKYGVEASTKKDAQADFQIKNYSFALEILKIILIILAAIALLIFILSIPAMPREIHVKTVGNNLVMGAPDITTTRKIKFGVHETQKSYSVRGVNGQCTTNTVYRIRISRPENKYYWGLKNCSWVKSRGIYIGTLCLKKADPVYVKFTVDSIVNVPGLINTDPTVSQGETTISSIVGYTWTELIENDGVQRSLKANVDFSVNKPVV